MKASKKGVKGHHLYSAGVTTTTRNLYKPQTESDRLILLEESLHKIKSIPVFSSDFLSQVIIKEESTSQCNTLEDNSKNEEDIKNM